MPLLILLLIVVPIAELYVIIQVGQWIGVWPTIALLLLDSVVGAWLLRQQGRAAWRRFQEAMGAGRVPAREAIDGVLVVIGGALLLTPGFLSDIGGIFLLLPPGRALVRQLVLRRRGWLAGAAVGGAARGRSRRRGATSTGPRMGRRPDDIDVTAVDRTPRSEEEDAA